MANLALSPFIPDELMLVEATVPDRLPAMLFLAALVHGILIIGVTFNASLSDSFTDAISLEVTVVADPDQQIDRPDDAAYLAQASQQGGGNTTSVVRPSAPLQSSMPVDNPGREDGSGIVDASAHERSADEVIAVENEADRRVAVNPRTEPQTEESTAIAMESGREETLPLPREESASMLIRDDEPRELIVSADTRQSVVAAYLDAWKRRIEAVGAAYLPQLGDIGDISGSPTLMVSIEASGDLVDAIIRRSSGSTILDLAALDILQRASPFKPFPDEIAAEYETLRFEYKWLFVEQLVATPAPAE